MKAAQLCPSGPAKSTLKGHREIFNPHKQSNHLFELEQELSDLNFESLGTYDVYTFEKG